MGSKVRIFEVEETKGDLPYIVTWISLDGRLSSSSYGSYKEAMNHYSNLSTIGREPSICLNLINKPTGIKKKKDASLGVNE